VLVNFTAQSEKVTTDSLVGRLLESVPLPRSSL
jgi:MoxR-like ATPase